MPTEAVHAAVASDWFDRFARVGYVAKGVVFGIVGVLAMRVALGQVQEEADFYAAFEELGEQPLNVVLLGLLSLGLFAYALWRLAQGVLDVEGEGRDWRGLGKRASYVLLGLTYGAFGVYALGVLGGWSTENDEIRDVTASALAWPLGEWLVGAAGVVVLGFGVVELYYAFSRTFEVELGPDEYNAVERVSITAAGWYGHSARGVVYGAAGIFAIRAALDYDPDEARGLTDTFRELAGQPFGVWLVGFIAAGFIAFGIYNALLALHRHIPNESLLRGRDEEGEVEPG